MKVRRSGRQPGFTIIEVLFVVVIAGILGTLAVPQIAKYSSQKAAQNARTAFMMTAARARAAAIQAGDDVQMVVDANGREVRILNGAGDAVAEPLNLQTGPARGQIVGTDGFTLSYTPRGFARPATGIPDAIGFVSPQGRDTAWVRVTPGRMERGL